jgi:hypothetical protein
VSDLRARKPPPHLTEPHYYRLGYQLAAQYANWLLSPGSDEPQERPGQAAAERALEVAEQVSSEARSITDWYGWREENHRFWKPRGPSALLPKERRLRRFLEGTVTPSADLVRGGLLVTIFEDPVGAERLAEPIRARTPDEDDLSYRALYNLACYESTRGASGFSWLDEPFTFALEDLALAFGRVDGLRRQELARWSLSDPALEPLRRAEPRAFARLLARYGSGVEPSRHQERRQEATDDIP